MFVFIFISAQMIDAEWWMCAGSHLGECDPNTDPTCIQPCHGDSGGAVVCYGQDGRMYQYGVSSWSPEMCRGGAGASAKVQRVLDWIEMVVGVGLTGYRDRTFPGEPESNKG